MSEKETSYSMQEPITREVVAPLTELQAPPPAKSLRIASLGSGESLTVQTRNSTYRIIMLKPAEQKVLIRGGNHLPRPTEAILLGHFADGKIRVGQLVKGLGLAVAVGRRCFVTSPIESLQTESLGSADAA